MVKFRRIKDVPSSELLDAIKASNTQTEILQYLGFSVNGTAFRGLRKVAEARGINLPYVRATGPKSGPATKKPVGRPSRSVEDSVMPPKFSKPCSTTHKSCGESENKCCSSTADSTKYMKVVNRVSTHLDKVRGQISDLEADARKIENELEECRNMESFLTSLIS